MCGSCSTILLQASSWRETLPDQMHSLGTRGGKAKPTLRSWLLPALPQQGRPAQGRERLPSPSSSPRSLQVAARELPLEQHLKQSCLSRSSPCVLVTVLLKGESMERGGRAVCACMDGLGLSAHNELAARLLCTNELYRVR